MVFVKSRFLMIILCCFFFVSCKKTDNIIFSYIDSTCPQGGVFNMKKALRVDYDTAFLFWECTNDETIEMVLGLSYPYKTFLQDSEYKLILLKNHRIVYDNNFYCRRVEFFFRNSNYRYTKDNILYCYRWSDSIFEASYLEMRDGPMYKLYPYTDF